MSPKALILAVSLATGSAAFALPLSASAQEADRPAPQRPIRAQVIFNLIDVNGDGFIDQTEIAALQRAIFAAVDTDGDTKLSKEEFAKATPGHRAGRFARFMRQHGPHGDHMGPGFHRGGRDGGPRGDRHGQMQPQDFDQTPGAIPPPAREADAQSIPGEFVDGRQRFAVLDIDGDGVVSLEEFALADPR